MNQTREEGVLGLADILELPLTFIDKDDFNGRSPINLLLLADGVLEVEDNLLDVHQLFGLFSFGVDVNALDFGAVLTQLDHVLAVVFV